MKIKSKHTVITVFLKAPVKGLVKTRLAKLTGDEAALKIYIRFVEHTLAMLSKTDYAIHAYFYPAHETESIRKLLGDEIPFFPQKGNDLGERMKHAIEDAFSKGFTKAILVGTDIPDLSTDIINDAVITLDRHPAVIGPSADGGYYLVGFHSSGFIPDIFIHMPWGTSRVLEKTMSIFEVKHMDVPMLNQRRDIDTYEDLRAFLSEKKSNTSEYKDILETINPIPSG